MEPNNPKDQRMKRKMIMNNKRIKSKNNLATSSSMKNSNNSFLLESNYESENSETQLISRKISCLNSNTLCSSTSNIINIYKNSVSIDLDLAKLSNVPISLSSPDNTLLYGNKYIHGGQICQANSFPSPNIHETAQHNYSLRKDATLYSMSSSKGCGNTGHSKRLHSNGSSVTTYSDTLIDVPVYTEDFSFPKSPICQTKMFSRKRMNDGAGTSYSSTSYTRKPLVDISNVIDDSRPKSLTYSSTPPNRMSTYGSNQNTSATKLDPGKHVLKRKRQNISAIPIDLSVTNEQPHCPPIQNKILGMSEDYIDHGDQTYMCQLCNAMLWHAEAKRGNGSTNKSSFSLCCGYGKVKLPPLKTPPPLLHDLFLGRNAKSANFIKNIRQYNMMFAFTSMGGKVDNSYNSGGAPYVFRLHGQNYHTMGSLLPERGKTPKFSQLYIYDTENEDTNRQNALRSRRNTTSSTSNVLDKDVITSIRDILDSNNVLVKCYRMVRDCYVANEHKDVRLRLIGRRLQDGRTYNLPSASEVAALIVGDIDNLFDKRDIVVETQSGNLRRISELHPSYLPLQYPILFPYGEDGYRVDIPHTEGTSSSTGKIKNCTMREFFAYRIQDRRKMFSSILYSRRLYQQFLVDAYTMIESERLYFIRKHQKVLRCESYEKLCNIHDVGITDVSSAGQRVVLPSSFTGGARYMMQNYLDAMTLCKWFGYPDLFLTVTCNPKWPEITRFLSNTGLRPEDRPDILCRMFKIKLDHLISVLREKNIFGETKAIVYTVEFQKRGLPHSHICIFLKSGYKLPTVEHIDPIISAELPDKEEDPVLYSLVTEYMMHGPCGLDNPRCPCMSDNKCTKNFPKKFSDSTSINGDGFPVYRRRNDGRTTLKSGVLLDNRNVVAYNKVLLKQFQAHINVEWCNQAGSIKYLFKYINKGPDRVSVTFDVCNNDEQQEIDEVKEFYNCRYLSACEATWRIFSYDVHYRNPPVKRLPFHLPGQQQVVYQADDHIDDVLDKSSVASSMFMNWMECNKIYKEARNLTYAEFPTKFVWIMNDRRWKPRKQEGCFSIGRIHQVSPTLGEPYYLRILLNIVKGPTCFEDIRTFKYIVYETFRDTCYAMGLLDDDKEYIECIEEASHAATGYYIRSLFAMMLMSHSLSQPHLVWGKTWSKLSDGILHREQLKSGCQDLLLEPEQLQNLTLIEIEKIMNRNNSSLKSFETMPYPVHTSISSSHNRLISDELEYDRNVLEQENNQLLCSLTSEQKGVFDNVIAAIENNQGGVFFVYGFGGTGKTFVWKTLSAFLRYKGDIVINVASSGIASLLLTGGRTAHSRFHIPINLNEDSMCFIKPDSDTSSLLRETKLIIWDEAPMVHRHAFEAFDRTMRDIMSLTMPINADKPFGGKVIVFGGDFRQILPVIPKGSRQDIVNASLNSSYIWRDCKVLKLTVNMRLLGKSDTSDFQETKEFAEWILNVGEGKVGGPNDGEVIIDIPDDLLINDSTDPIGSIIEFVYPFILSNLENISYFQERAILAPTHEVVDVINDRLLNMFPGEERVYLSSDSLCESEHVYSDFDKDLYSPDVLNGLKLSGLPNHKLVLKVGVPVMLLRNIDQPGGLCNGTRLQIIRMGERVIEAQIISGINIGKRTFIPRMRLSPSDKRIPFKIQRKQFPIAVCFAMTINKSQGQSLSKVGLFLKRPVFTHGQFYVAVSRVTSRNGLKVLVLDKDGNITNKTSNVVYKEVLRNV